MRALTWPFKICLAWGLGAPVIRHSNNARDQGDLHAPAPTWYWRLLSRNRQCVQRWRPDKAPVSSHPLATFLSFHRREWSSQLFWFSSWCHVVTKRPSRNHAFTKGIVCKYLFIFKKNLKTSFLSDVYLQTRLFVVGWHLCQSCYVLFVIFWIQLIFSIFISIQLSSK